MIPQRGGLPHSDIHGSTPARGSPWLFAACHVLHRLLVPRHPPNALILLEVSPCTETIHRSDQPFRINPTHQQLRPTADPYTQHTTSLHTPLNTRRMHEGRHRPQGTTQDPQQSGQTCMHATRRKPSPRTPNPHAMTAHTPGTRTKPHLARPEAHQNLFTLTKNTTTHP